MLHAVSLEELTQLIAAEHPSWTVDAVRKQAEEYLLSMDKRMEVPLRSYLDTGKPVNFREGEFSLMQIQSLRRGCGILTAVVLMDAYLKDPVKGKAMILRR